MKKTPLQDLPLHSRILCPLCHRTLINDTWTIFCHCDGGHLKRYCAVLSEPTKHVEKIYLSLKEFHLENDYQHNLARINEWRDNDATATILTLPNTINWNLNDIPALIRLIKTYVTFQ